MIVEEIVGRLGFQVDHEQLHKVNESLEGIKSRLEFLAAAEVLRGMFEITERFAKFAEEIHIASEAAGISVAEFQKLSFAAQESSISQEEMQNSLRHLSRTLYEAKQGSAEAQKAFAQIGLTSGQVTGFKNSRDALLAISDRFQHLNDPIKRQALSMEVFGRGAGNMAGFLAKGSAAIKQMGDEAESLGVILSKDQIESLVKVEHAMQKVWAVIKAVGAVVAANLGPSLEYAIKVFLSFYEANNKIITGKLSEWIYNVLYAMGFLFGILETLIKKVYEFGESHQRIRALIFTAFEVGAAFVALGLAMQGVVGIWGLLTAAVNFGLTPIRIMGTALLWLRGAIAQVLLSMAAMIDSELLLGAAGAVAEAPLWLIAAAIAAVVVAAHDLWTILSGGKLADTWLGKLWAGGKSFLGFGNPDNAANVAGASTALNGLPDAAGIGSTASALGGISHVPDFGANSGPAPATSIPAEGGGGYTVNAPVNINVEASPHKDLGDKVKEGVKEHLDRVYRETHRSLRSPVAY